MNTMTDLGTIEQPSTEAVALLTIKPEKYVVEVFQPFNKDLASAIRAASKTPDYDITTTAGLTMAKVLRASFREIRTRAENTRKDRKAPIIEIGKLLDTRYKELEAKIRPHEDKYDAEIKAEEQRKEDEKQRKIEAERVRIEAIQNRIANIRNLPQRHLQSDSATIARAIDALSTLVLDPADYEELLEDGINAVNAAIVELETLRKVATLREAEAKRIADERAELARLKAEKEESDRKALEEAKSRAAEERKRQEESDAKAAEQARMIAELQAQLAAANKPKEPEPSIAEKVSEVVIPAPITQKAIVQIKPKRPSDAQIILALREYFATDEGTPTDEDVAGWLMDMDLTDYAKKAA
jgi:DNA repair exonuclease SbcCD ATPase subunit